MFALEHLLRSTTVTRMPLEASARLTRLRRSISASSSIWSWSWRWHHCTHTPYAQQMMESTRFEGHRPGTRNLACSCGDCTQDGQRQSVVDGTGDERESSPRFFLIDFASQTGGHRRRRHDLHCNSMVKMFLIERSCPSLQSHDGCQP